MTYEELIQRNRAEQEKRRKIERKKLMVKCTVNATIFVVCGAVLTAEGAKRFEEAARRETEARRVAVEEAVCKREEERLAREKERQEMAEKKAVEYRRREEERQAVERERADRELAAYRKREAERLAKEAQARRLQEEEKTGARIAMQRNASIGKMAQSVDKKRNVDTKYQVEFFAARRNMGGSVLEALTRRLNNIDDDEMAKSSARIARALAMKAIAGSIGPVKYELQVRTKKITSTQAIGGVHGYVHGGVVSGTIYGPVTSIKEKVGGYEANVPPGFKTAFEQMMKLARCGHSRANAEAGACIFVDATKGQIGMDERKSLTLFAKAAELGDADGMYMQAFCLFYGIGRMNNNKKDLCEAYRILSNWKSHPDSQSLRNSGWARRRLDEARQLGY